MKSPPEGSRVAWSSATGANNITTIPWEKYENKEQVFDLLGEIEDIANKHGEFLLGTFL